MQEEVENRTVTLTISGAKLTGRTLKWAIRQFLNHHSKSQARKAQAAAITPRGKQSVAELVGQNQGVQNIEISDKNIKDFDRVARKYGIDYAVKKDTTEEIPKYLVFFKAWTICSASPRTAESWDSTSASSILICRMTRLARSICVWITSTASGTRVRRTN